MPDEWDNDWNEWDEPDTWNTWVCHCDMCEGRVEPPGYMEPDYDEIISRDEPLDPDESLHLDGCVLEGDHEGPCKFFFCGSNYCDDPACGQDHPELL